MRQAIAEVAAALGNTPAVCRKSYIHPTVISAYLDGRLVVVSASKGGSETGDGTLELRSDEAATLALLRGESGL